jgi:hypothetical protein
MVAMKNPKFLYGYVKILERKKTFWRW